MGRLRGAKALAVVVLALTAAGCLGHPPHDDPARITLARATPARVTPLRVTIIGDSLTQQYGPVFQRVVQAQGAVVTGRWHGGTNPVDDPWSTWVREWSGVDYVVLQDAAVLRQDVHHDLDEYLAAWQALVDSAHTVLRPGGQVVVMDGNQPDLSSIQGVDRFMDQVDPDSPDGIHWTEAGSTAQAALLCQQLFEKDTCR